MNADIDSKEFTNALFQVFEQSGEQLGVRLVLKCVDDLQAPINFRVALRGRWADTPLDHGD